MNPIDRYLDIGFRVHLRIWEPGSSSADRQSPFLLIHGLSSNARTWDQVAFRLAAAGHRVLAVDQRGHGLSDKPDAGYDFSTLSTDLQALLHWLDRDDPILVGQSWGGNVLLEFAAYNPGVARGYAFVDGGFINLRERGSWEEVAAELQPPQLGGLPQSYIADRIRESHPQWSEAGIEATLGNFEILPDQTIRPWLTRERHMRILKFMYDQDLTTLYSRVTEPLLICAADDDSESMPQKREQVQAAGSKITNADVIWFEDSAHDIHVDQPDRLADALLAFQP